MSETVAVATVAACPTAVVRKLTTWGEFPRLWRPMLDQVYAFLRHGDGPVRQDGHNIMLYLDDRPLVEVGVQVSGSFAPSGEVVPSVLPGGRVARVLHHGPWGQFDAPYQALNDFCSERGLVLAGPRWEIYGDPVDDPALLETEICYLLA